MNYTFVQIARMVQTKTRTTVHSIHVRQMNSDVIMDGVSLNPGNATMKMVIKISLNYFIENCSQNSSLIDSFPSFSSLFS